MVKPAQSAELIEALLRDTPRSGHEVFCGIDNGPCDGLLRDGVEEVAAAAKAEGRTEGEREWREALKGVERRVMPDRSSCFCNESGFHLPSCEAARRLLAQSENTEA